MWKLKLPEGKDRWIFLLTVGVILCILAFPVGSKSSRGTLPLSRMEAENVTASAPGSQDAAAYEQKLEKRVRCGNPISLPGTADGTYRVYSQDRQFLCLSQARGGTLTSIKNFFGA